MGGVQTTLPFHGWLLDQPAFATATGLSTELVERTWQPAPIVQQHALLAAELAVRAALAAPPAAPPAEPAAAAWWQAGVADELESRL